MKTYSTKFPGKHRRYGWVYEYFGVKKPFFVAQSNYKNSKKTVYFGGSQRRHKDPHDVGVWVVKYKDDEKEV